MKHADKLEVKGEKMFREMLLPHPSHLKIACSACNHACYVQDDETKYGYLARKKLKFLINKMREEN